ncbi:hypothetical protein MJO28_004243 [Puccinia striiformis f. sp. tritici]|uniref:Uncharacterized protein n=1 Tax=Puccinia striiformis f. sp. tritici TaxID=168172 RepID=A0ACC0EQ41_9BASI|nr:hypothetical protein MJO28_004243 [Puccinia striiformis f. sp. tritici]
MSPVGLSLTSRDLRGKPCCQAAEWTKDGTELGNSSFGLLFKSSRRSARVGASVSSFGSVRDALVKRRQRCHVDSKVVSQGIVAFDWAVKDVKARQVKFQELRGSEGGDNGLVQDDEERDIDWAGDDNSTSIKENHKQKIIDEYGLDELNSDEDFEDFEEVEYDQFTSSKNKKKTTQQQQPRESSTPKQTTTVDNNDDKEKEEEEVVG